jgi:hypothetical protein
MKKATILILACLIVFLATGCGQQKTSSRNEERHDPAPGNPRITMSVQEYIGDNIAEIPYIEYDGEKNERIDAINRSLHQGIGQIYSDFMASRDDVSWIEIKTYPFTSEKYLQAVVTWNTYPSYGTWGDILSINFDRETGEWITNDMALTMDGLTMDGLVRAVRESYQPDIASLQIQDVELGGFVILDGNVQYLLVVSEGTDEASVPSKTFYQYVHKYSSLSQMDPGYLYDPSIPGYLDEMNPPLAYGRE